MSIVELARLGCKCSLKKKEMYLHNLAKITIKMMGLNPFIRHHKSSFNAIRNGKPP